MTEAWTGTPERTAYPALTAWLQGIGADHRWAELLATPDEYWPLLDPMETIISTLERVRPLRLERKRKASRTDRDDPNALNLRFELLMAYRLAAASIPFDFGGEGEPDLHCPYPGQPVWLELTARDRDDHAKFHDDLETALAGLDVVVTLEIPKRRLVIPVADREAMCTRVRAAVETVNQSSFGVPLPEIEAQARCLRQVPSGPTRVGPDIGSELSRHFHSVEREILNVIETKTEQAQRGGFDPTTVLVIDGARLGIAWARPTQVWDAMLDRMAVPWPDMPFAGLMVAFTSLERLTVRGYYKPRPDLGVGRVAAIDPVLRALGFTPQ